VLWDRKLPKSPYGDATVTNDLVFTTTLDGKVIAFNRRTGATVWQKSSCEPAPTAQWRSTAIR
jgi:outer membrane protein assembly factor BamB